MRSPAQELGLLTVVYLKGIKLKNQTFDCGPHLQISGSKLSAELPN